MTRTLALLLLLTGCSSAQAMADPPPGYKLVWSDEFNSGTRPDPTKWKYDTRANKIRWWHEEAEYYAADRPKNARIENGKLVIEMHHEDMAQMADYGGQHYSSARLVTRDIAQWTYGFFEVRARLPCNRGGWPAIWLFSPTVPSRGEIDIMEQLGFDPATVHAAAHSQANPGQTGDPSRPTTIAAPCDSFHDYQLDWRSSGITIAVDGRSYFHIDRPAGLTPGAWAFDTPEYLILNFAMGGAWAGQKGIDDNALPARFEIDYVRVYQPR